MSSNSFGILVPFFRGFELKIRKRGPAHSTVFVRIAEPTCVISLQIVVLLKHAENTPDSKANMGPIWGRQDAGGPHVGPVNLAIWNPLWVWEDRLSICYWSPVPDDRDIWLLRGGKKTMCCINICEHALTKHHLAHRCQCLYVHNT